MIKNRLKETELSGGQYPGDATAHRVGGRLLNGRLHQAEASSHFMDKSVSQQIV